MKVNTSQSLDSLNLPIHLYKDELVDAIKKYQVVIICGETGSGKSTQLPQFCLQAGLISKKSNGKFRQIAHTQPRRMAAISLSKRISQELQNSINSNTINLPPDLEQIKAHANELVGYKIRFEDKVSSNSLIKLMTDGILVAELQSDVLLQKYSTIIIDEAHERNINVDFLLGHLKGIFSGQNEKSNKNLRPDLRLIITSATLESEKLSKFFNDAPVFKIEGRGYPVDIHYREISPENQSQNTVGSSKEEQDRKEAWREDKYAEILPKAIASAINELWFGSSSIQNPNFGDVLVFLPGEAEIREVFRYLQNHFPQKVNLEVLPLFSRLTSAEQMKIFNPTESNVRVILSTNIAETSLTVPRIKYVIDSGLARVIRYSPRQKINRLEVEPIAQDAAMQRAGRCGRTSNGICIRLYSEEDFTARAIQTTPEIARSSCSQIILRMLEMGLGDIRTFNWIDPPSDRIIHQGINELTTLSAIKNNQLTVIGRQMARMPVAHTLSRMLIAAQEKDVLAGVLIIVSALSTREVREIPQNETERARVVHRKFNHPDSDFLTLINLWQEVEKARAKAISNSQFRKWTKTNYLSWLRLKEWRELHLQLQTICKNIFKNNSLSKKVDIANIANARAIHQSLLIGMPFNIGRKHDSENYYMATNALKFLLDRNWQNKKTRWVISAEIVAINKSSLPFARKIAKLDEKIIVETLSQFLQYKNLPAFWDNNFAGGKVMIHQQISLGGLIINPRARAIMQPKTEEEIIEAREVFVNNALVKSTFDEITFQAKNTKELSLILIENQKTIHKLLEKEKQLRRPQTLISEEMLFQFYEKAILNNFSENIFGIRELCQKINQHPQKLNSLKINYEQWLNKKSTWQVEKYPGKINCNGVNFKLTYTFAPMQKDDGITIEVPLALLPMLSRNHLDWLVPGMLGEKIDALIRSLPKSVRFKLRSPHIIDGFIDEVCEENLSTQPPMLNVLADYCTKSIDTKITTELFREEIIAEHLKMRIKIIDENGQVLICSRSFDEVLKLIKKPTSEKKHSGNSLKIDSNIDCQLIREVDKWDFGDLPQKKTVEISEQKIECDVILIVNKAKIHLAVIVNPELAIIMHNDGLIALAKKSLNMQINNFIKTAPRILNLGLPRSWFTNDDDLHQSIIHKALAKCLLTPPLPQSSSDFDQKIRDCKNRFLLITKSINTLITEIAKKYKEIQTIIESPKNNSFVKQVSADVENTINDLFGNDFFNQNDFDSLSHYPRYLNAILRRIEKYRKNPERDKKNAFAINNFAEKIDRLNTQLKLNESEYKKLILFLNELRVGLFAEELKTAMPISIKRMEKIIAEKIAKS